MVEGINTVKAILPFGTNMMPYPLFVIVPYIRLVATLQFVIFAYF